MSRGGCWGSASSCTEGARGVCRKDGYDPLDSSSAEDVAMSGISSRTLSLRSLPQLPGEGDSGPMEVHTGEVTWAGWSPAEPSLLASTSYDGTVCAVSVDEHTGATVKWKAKVSDDLLVNGAWSADGARIACTCTGQGVVLVVDAGAEPPRVEWEDKHLVGKQNVMPTALGWCPRPGAPEQLAIGSSDGAVRLVDVQNQTQLWKIDDEHTDEVRGLAWSADGDRLASVSADETLRVGVLKGAAIDSSALIRLILEREAAQLPEDVAAQLEEFSDSKLRKIALKLEVSPSHTPDRAACLLVSESCRAVLMSCCAAFCGIDSLTRMPSTTRRTRTNPRKNSSSSSSSTRRRLRKSRRSRWRRRSRRSRQARARRRAQQTARSSSTNRR